MQRVTVCFSAVGFLLCGLCIDHTAMAQQRRVLRARESALSEVPVEAGNGRTFLSPDGKRFAYVTEEIDESGHSFKIFNSGEREPVSLDRLVSGTPVFSADGEHLVIAGKDGDSWKVFHDRRPSNPYRGIWDDSVRLSPDGGRVAFVAEREGNKSGVVFDDQLHGSYDSVLDGSITFSPDGKHIAYSPRNGVNQFVVLDDQPTAAFEKVGRPLFSQNGAHLAFVASRSGKWRAIVDGKEGDVFDGINAESLTFAPDAERVAYVATVGTKRQAIVGGRPVGEAYPWVFSDSLVFSADGKRFAFAARLAGIMAVVVDGKEEPAYRSIVPGSIRFSPDGKRVAYIAERPGPTGAESLRIMVVDGVEGKPFRWIRGPAVFSADSKRVGYIAQRPATGGEGWVCFLVLDGIEGNAYPWIRGQPTLSADGSGAAFIAAAPDERFADADEMPWNPDTPGAGGRLTLDARRRSELGADLQQKALSQAPIRIIAVEERLAVESGG